MFASPTASPTVSPAALLADLVPLIRKFKGDENKVQEEIAKWWSEPAPVQEEQWVTKSTKKKTGEKLRVLKLKIVHQSNTLFGFLRSPLSALHSY